MKRIVPSFTPTTPTPKPRRVRTEQKTYRRLLGKLREVLHREVTNLVTLSTKKLDPDHAKELVRYIHLLDGLTDVEEKIKAAIEARKAKAKEAMTDEELRAMAKDLLKAQPKK
jgi:hypothetical protein